MGESVTSEVPLPDEAATMMLGRTLAESLPSDPSGCLVALRGELGAGKTTLVRALLRGLGHRGAVPSPTYTLVEPYEFAVAPVYHVDLYRIAGADELEFLGWTDLREGLVLVEWPERVPDLTAAADVDIELVYAGDGRIARVSARTDRGAGWLVAAGLMEREG